MQRNQIMQTKEFIEFLIDNHMPVFRLTEATKILHHNKAYTVLFLHRCVKNGLIGRVERGLYYVMQRHNEYEIASHVLDYSYISMVSALAYYGLTTQIPKVVYVVSTKRHSIIRNVQGINIIFKRIKKEMLFGYHKESNGNIFIADPEKAIIDIYYFNDLSDLDETMLNKPARININKLVLYAQKSRKRYIMRKISELLKYCGYNSDAKRLAEKAVYKKSEKRR